MGWGVGGGKRNQQTHRKRAIPPANVRIKRKRKWKKKEKKRRGKEKRKKKV